MNLALALLLCGPIAAEASTATTTTPKITTTLENLNFSAGTLAHWEGEGFALTTGTGRSPSVKLGVTSSDRGEPGRTGMLHRMFTVPPRGGVLKFRAHVVLAKDSTGGPDLDVILFAAGKKLIAKRIRTVEGWQEVTHVLKVKGKPREYLFDLAPYAGQVVRLALVDDDRRAGCHVFATDFAYQASEDFNSMEFEDYMVRLVAEQRLDPVAWFESPRFKALSNAGDEFSKIRLANCEVMYDMFFDHFQRKGFVLREPTAKLMVAVFSNQAGMNAYIGEQLPYGVTGLYHPKSNRLVVYDFGENDLFVAMKKAALSMGNRIKTDMERRRYQETILRRGKEFRTGTNISTVMHEVAHQLSFNTGMLNRDGDVPLWLAEGLACYCESTDGGSVWQGIGEYNVERAGTLVDPKVAKGQRLPLLNLVQDDEWLRGKQGPVLGILGYAQSWALFRMLVEERPQQLQAYLRRIYSRKVTTHRVADFEESFGDIKRLQLRYGEYMKQIMLDYKPTKR